MSALAAAGLGLAAGLACAQAASASSAQKIAALERQVEELRFRTGESGAELKAQLTNDGYCVVPAALSGAEIEDLAATCHELLDAPENKKPQDDKFTGSLIPLSKHPKFAELIAHKATLGAPAWPSWASSRRAGCPASSSASRPAARAWVGTRTAGTGTRMSPTRISPSSSSRWTT
eukprot:SAG22_NODE_877_length_6715_cov_28.285369_7_plen_176_part_00